MSGDNNPGTSCRADMNRPVGTKRIVKSVADGSQAIFPHAARTAAQCAATRDASGARLGVSNVNESGQPSFAMKIASGQPSGRSGSAAWKIQPGARES